jgi:hypothetical protein
MGVAAEQIRPDERVNAKAKPTNRVFCCLVMVDKFFSAATRVRTRLLVLITAAILAEGFTY